jgi:hypothetical protein
MLFGMDQVKLGSLNGERCRPPQRRRLLVLRDGVHTLPRMEIGEGQFPIRMLAVVKEWFMKIESREPRAMLVQKSNESHIFG